MNLRCSNHWFAACFVATLLSLASFGSCAEIVVITNINNPVEKLTRKQVIDLYMGRQLNFPDGSPALPVDQAQNSAVRAAYYQALVGKSVAEINAYWARLLFTGMSSPPRVLPTPEDVLKVVSGNPQAIAYVYTVNIEKFGNAKKIKIVFRLNDN